MLLFLLASALVSMSDSLELMIIARFLQGFFVTAPIIGGITMLFELTKKDEQVFWMSISSTSITCAIASAPIVGTIINETCGFRGNLWAILVAGMIAIIPVYAVVPETLGKKKRTAIDTKNVLKNYWAILTNREFMSLAAAVSAPVAGYWVYAGASSLYLIDYVGVSSSSFGVYQGSITGTFAIVSLGFSFLHKRFGARMCMWAGFFGNNLLFPRAIQHLPQNLQGSGQSIIQSLRLSLSAIGTVFLGLTYQGPFLPIAIFLLLMFLMSSLLIWQSRADLAGAQQAVAHGVIPASH
jgi:MFS family permease